MRSLFVLSGLLAAASASYAFPITFTLQGVGTGTVGSSPFTSFTITVSTDTTEVDTIPVLPPYTEYLYSAGNAEVNISGVGSGTITNQNFLYMYQYTISPSNSGVGMYGTPFPSAGNMSMDDISLASYELQSAFGPLTADAFTEGYTFNSTLGTVDISSLSSLTFTATTPEPATAPLAAVVLGLVALVDRRRRMQLR